MKFVFNILIFIAISAVVTEIAVDAWDNYKVKTTLAADGSDDDPLSDTDEPDSNEEDPVDLKITPLFFEEPAPLSIPFVLSETTVIPASSDHFIESRQTEPPFSPPEFM